MRAPGWLLRLLHRAGAAPAARPYAGPREDDLARVRVLEARVEALRRARARFDRELTDFERETRGGR